MADASDWEDMLDEILDYDGPQRLGPKEMDFVEDLGKRCRDGPLTERQFDWLESIWKRLFD